VHKEFGHGYESIEEWEKDEAVLRDSLMEVVAGVTELLAREFGDTGAQKQQGELTQFQLQDGTKIKGSIIEQSEERIVVRLEGGSIRSMLAEKVVAVNQ